MTGPRLGVFAVAVAMLVARVAAADPAPSPDGSGAGSGAGSADPTAALQLFDDGRALARQGDFAAACDRFERALAIDPLALGTALNLADCYEKRGLTASAFHLFDHVADEARQLGDDTKARFARDRADLLVRQLVRVDLRIADPAPDVVVTINREAVSPAAVIHELTDAGPIVIDASRPGRAPFHAERRASAGSTVTFDVVFVDPSAVVAMPPPPPPRRRRSWMIAGIAAGGAGVASFAVGLGVAHAAAHDHDLVIDDGLCTHTPAGLACTPAGASRELHAGSLADTATALTVAGALVAAGGVALCLFAPRPHVRSVAISPVVGGGEIGIAIDAAF